MGLAKKIKREAVKEKHKTDKEVMYAVNRKIATDATMFATENTLVFVLTALRDKFGFGEQRLSRLLNAYNELARCANEGYVKAGEVREQLLKECPSLKDRFKE
jgi:hypothetical protein